MLYQYVAKHVHLGDDLQAVIESFLFLSNGLIHHEYSLINFVVEEKV